MFDTPGIYRRAVRPAPRGQGPLARRDVACFAGFATRGPVDVPVQVESHRRFVEVFGAGRADGFLSAAVAAFFANGGRTAFVVRVTGPAPDVARATMTGHGQVADLSARVRIADLVPGGLEAPPPWAERLVRDHGRMLPEPGAWGNGLAFDLVPERVASVRAAVLDAASGVLAARVPGLAAGARVSVDGAGSVVVAAVDAARGTVTLAEPIAGGAAQVLLVALRLAATVTLDGRAMERFAALDADPGGPRYWARVVSEQSRVLDVKVAGAFRSAASGFPPGPVALTGGTEDLVSVGAADWRRAVAAQSDLPAIALIAVPDLVRQGEAPPAPAAPPQDRVRACHLPVGAPTARLRLRIVDAATGGPLQDVSVEVAGLGGVVAEAGPDPVTIDALPVGLHELRLRRAGYLPLVRLVTAVTGRPEMVTLRMERAETIPALTRADLEEVQRALADPDLAGAHRIAVLDPPAPRLPPEDLLAWRAGLGDLQRGVAVAPWLVVGAAEMPPSGHVCGLFARAEAEAGVHRAPGGLALMGAQALAGGAGDPRAPGGSGDAGGFAAVAHATHLNVIAVQPGRGLRLMGSRLATHDALWQQASVRRLFDAIEITLAARLAWAVFEPADASLRAVFAFSIAQFLEGLRGAGMLRGDTPAAAYSVTCDATTTSDEDARAGRLIARIEAAPSKPYEFIAFTIVAEAGATGVTIRP